MRARPRARARYTTGTGPGTGAGTGSRVQDQYQYRWWKIKVVGTGGNRSPSIARMVWDIVTSVYSSPKAFRSAESDEFDVLSALAAWAVPYRWPTKSDDPGDAGTETKVVEPTGRTS